MSLTTDKNRLREGLIDAVLTAILTNETNGMGNWDQLSGSFDPKVIRDGRIVDSGGEIYSWDKQVLFSKDYKSIYGFEGDFIDIALDQCYKPDGADINQYSNVDFSENGLVIYDSSTDQITLSCEDDSSYVIDIPEELLKSWFSQYITPQTGSVNIDSIRAEQILDTNIFELMPQAVSRQERIDKWFNEFYYLIGDLPNYDLDVDFDGVPDTWETAKIETKQDKYFITSSVEENPEYGNIVRLERHATGTKNEGQSIEYLRNELNKHLTDIDKTINPVVQDNRPEYDTRSDGYLKIRNLNQSILIRNEQGTDVGIIGQDINNPLYLKDGFTIGMWVRFLDRTGGGTLFNFGNPVRETNPSGFRLETYTLYKHDLVRPDKGYTWLEYIKSHTENSTWKHAEIETNENYFSEDHTFFENNDYERFVRLIVRESNNFVRESSVGCRQFKEGVRLSRLDMGDVNKVPSNGEYPIIWPQNQDDADTFYPNRLLTYTRIPIDFQEWFFVVATYDPEKDEDGSHAYSETYAPDGTNTLQYFSEFWHGHVIPEDQPPTDNQIAASDGNLTASSLIGRYTARSDWGNRCKVEVISRSHLLRARGFKVDDIATTAAGGQSDTAQIVGG